MHEITIRVKKSFKLKLTVKLPRYRYAGDKGERKYSSYSFLTSALDGVSGQRHAPVLSLPTEKDHRYPLDRRLVGLRAGLDTEARIKIICF
jgi:hypothetical protein